MTDNSEQQDTIENEQEETIELLYRAVTNMVYADDMLESIGEMELLFDRIDEYGVPAGREAGVAAYKETYNSFLDAREALVISRDAWLSRQA